MLLDGHHRKSMGSTMQIRKRQDSEVSTEQTQTRQQMTGTARPELMTGSRKRNSSKRSAGSTAKDDPERQ